MILLRLGAVITLGLPAGLGLLSALMLLFTTTFGEKKEAVVFERNGTKMSLAIASTDEWACC